MEKPTINNLWKGMKPFRKINKEEKKLVATLRSGKYRQAKEALRDGNRFCCLGVACDISKIKEWHGEYYMGESRVLPDKVKVWLGWSRDSGSLNKDRAVVLFPNRTYINDLANLNDRGVSFNKIARVIELGAVQEAK